MFGDPPGTISSYKLKVQESGGLLLFSVVKPVILETVKIALLSSDIVPVVDVSQ